MQLEGLVLLNQPHYPEHTDMSFSPKETICAFHYTYMQEHITLLRRKKIGILNNQGQQNHEKKVTM